MAKWGEIKCTNCTALEERLEAALRDAKEAEAYAEELEAKLAQMQRTLDWTEDRAKDYREGREMMGHKWAKAEEGRTKAVEAMERAVFLWEQPHYGDNDTIIDHGSEAIETLRTTLAELKGKGDE